MEQCNMNKKEGVLLLVVFVTYLLIGGVVFMFLESKHEQRQRTEVIEKIWQVDEEFFRGNHHNFTRDSLHNIINELAEAKSLGLIDKYGNQTHAKWDFANSVFFAITVVTTIGYGHLYPATAFGRTFCVLYGMIGIPLTGILLASIGDHFSSQLMRTFNKAKKMHTSKFAIAINTLSVFVPWLLVFVFLPAGLFMILEKWPYDVALYYSFITLATIGFGDFVAANNNVEYIWLYKIMLVAWIIFGLGYLSTILNFISKAMQSKKLKHVEDRISEKFSQFKVVLDNARRRSSTIKKRNPNNSNRTLRKKHRRSKSLDFDSLPEISELPSSPNWNIKDISIDSSMQTSDEVLTVNSLTRRKKRILPRIFERNNNRSNIVLIKQNCVDSNQVKDSNIVSEITTSSDLSLVTDDQESETKICIDADESGTYNSNAALALFQNLEDGRITEL